MSDLRMLGARDGIVTALVAIRREIGALTYHPINPRHKRKIAERERAVAPLRRLEKSLAEQMRRVAAAYEATREVA